MDNSLWPEEITTFHQLLQRNPRTVLIDGFSYTGTTPTMGASVLAWFVDGAGVHYDVTGHAGELRATSSLAPLEPDDPVTGRPPPLEVLPDELLMTWNPDGGPHSDRGSERFDAYGNAQSVEPVARAEPAAEATAVQQLIDSVYKAHDQADTTTAEVSGHLALVLRHEAHDRCRRLLAVDRSVHDGLVLAAEQMQDVRLDQVEQAPEVTSEDLFVETAIALFLLTPLFITPGVNVAFLAAARPVRAATVGAFKQASKKRYAAGAAMRAQRRAVDDDIKRLRPQVQAARLSALKTAEATPLKQFHRQLSDGLVARQQGISQELEQALQKRQSELAALRNIMLAQARSNRAASDRKSVERWLALERKGHEVSQAAATSANTILSESRKWTGRQTPIATTSVGVEMRRRGLSYLRAREEHLENVKTEADTLALEALACPDTAEGNVQVLIEIVEFLHTEPFDSRGLDAVTAEAFLAFEHLLWLYRIGPQLGSLQKQPTIIYWRDPIGGPPVVDTHDGDISHEVEVDVTVKRPLQSYLLTRFGAAYYQELYEQYEATGKMNLVRFREQLRKRYADLLAGVAGLQGGLPGAPETLVRFIPLLSAKSAG
jgi:hypothetical protein